MNQNDETPMDSDPIGINNHDSIGPGTLLVYQMGHEGPKYPAKLLHWKNQCLAFVEILTAEDANRGLFASAELDLFHVTAEFVAKNISAIVNPQVRIAQAERLRVGRLDNSDALREPRVRLKESTSQLPEPPEVYMDPRPDANNWPGKPDN